MELIHALESSRDEFCSAASELTSHQQNTRPAPGRWSVLDCAEHLVIVEGRFLGWLENAAKAGAPAANPEKEVHLARIMSNRQRKVTAPDPACPTGRYSSVAEALSDFHAARTRMIHFVQEQGDRIYGLAAQHPFLGSLNGAELVVVLASHTRRHLQQVEEIKSQLCAE
ncbi:MAG: DinB family protein [Bryobacteraceae bacterium]